MKGEASNGGACQLDRETIASRTTCAQQRHTIPALPLLPIDLQCQLPAALQLTLVAVGKGGVQVAVLDGGLAGVEGARGAAQVQRAKVVGAQPAGKEAWRASSAV